ncbi:MAG: hypothetical protein ACK45B_16080, partial [Limisphaerales bacterium]
VEVTNPLARPTTNGSGVVTFNWRNIEPGALPANAAPYNIEAEFAGDVDFFPATGTNTLTVTRENATMTYTGDLMSGDNMPLTLSVQLTQEADGHLGNLALAGTVEFTLVRTANPSQTFGPYTAAVQADGTATVTTGNLPAYTYTVVATLLANNYYTAAPTAPATIVAPTVVAVSSASGQYSDEVT